VKEESLLRSILADIIKGYSFHESGVYIKHLCLDDYVDYERVYQKHYDNLIKRGVETKDDLLKRAISQELWSEEEDCEIKDLGDFIERSEESLAKVLDKDMIKHHKEEIKKNQNRRAILINKRESIIQSSCEKLTDKRMHEHYVVQSLYKDRDFLTPYLSRDEIEDMDTDIGKYVGIYNDCMGNINEDSIKKVSIKPFFTCGWNLCKNAHQYFGKAISQITYNQMNLASYAKNFSNIFEAYPEIDSEDPDEIIKFAKWRQEADKKGDNVTFMNANAEEMKRAGIKTQNKDRQFNEMS